MRFLAKLLSLIFSLLVVGALVSAIARDMKRKVPTQIKEHK